MGEEGYTCLSHIGEWHPSSSHERTPRSSEKRFGNDLPVAPLHPGLMGLNPESSPQRAYEASNALHCCKGDYRAPPCTLSNALLSIIPATWYWGCQRPTVSNRTICRNLVLGIVSDAENRCQAKLHTFFFFHFRANLLFEDIALGCVRCGQKILLPDEVAGSQLPRSVACLLPSVTAAVSPGVSFAYRMHCGNGRQEGFDYQDTFLVVISIYYPQSKPSRSHGRSTSRTRHTIRNGAGRTVQHHQSFLPEPVSSSSCNPKGEAGSAFHER